jgi:hypothetical protein
MWRRNVGRVVETAAVGGGDGGGVVDGRHGSAQERDESLYE